MSYDQNQTTDEDEAIPDASSRMKTNGRLKNGVQEEEIIPIATNDDFYGKDIDYLNVHEIADGTSADIDDDRKGKSKVEERSIDKIPNHTARSGGMSVKVAKKSKLVLKKEVSPGRIHSIVVKDRHTNGPKL